MVMLKAPVNRQKLHWYGLAIFQCQMLISYPEAFSQDTGRAFTAFRAFG